MLNHVDMGVLMFSMNSIKAEVETIIKDMNGLKKEIEQEEKYMRKEVQEIDAQLRAVQKRCPAQYEEARRSDMSKWSLYLWKVKEAAKYDVGMSPLPELKERIEDARSEMRETYDDMRRKLKATRDQMANAMQQATSDAQKQQRQQWHEQKQQLATVAATGNQPLTQPSVLPYGQQKPIVKVGLSQPRQQQQPPSQPQPQQPKPQQQRQQSQPGMSGVDGQELPQLPGGTSGPSTQFGKQDLQPLLQVLRDQNTPEQENKIVSILKSNPPLMDAFIKLRQARALQREIAQRSTGGTIPSLTPQQPQPQEPLNSDESAESTNRATVDNQSTTKDAGSEGPWATDHRPRLVSVLADHAQQQTPAGMNETLQQEAVVTFAVPMPSERPKIRQIAAIPSQGIKEWHRSFSPWLRNHILYNMVEKLSSGPDPQTMLEIRKHHLSIYARKLEAAMYEVANSTDEYFDLLAKNSLRKELGEQAEKYKHLVEQHKVRKQIELQAQEQLELEEELQEARNRLEGLKFYFKAARKRTDDEEKLLETLESIL